MVAPRKRLAFTLVEILVIIAVTGILAWILYPIIGNARDQSRQTICMSHQKQPAMAMKQHAQNNNKTLPGNAGPVDDGTSWHEVEHKEHVANEIFSCPSSMIDGSLAHPSYGFNGYLYGASTTALTDPINTILTADASTSIILTEKDIDRNRHNGTYFASCVDGHVVALVPEQQSVVFQEGDEGHYLVFGVTSIAIAFKNDTTAIGTSKSVVEGTPVRVVNKTAETINPQVSSFGGELPPGKGFLTGQTNLQLTSGKCKIITLYCRMDAIGNQKVHTTYRFGDEHSMVEITVDPATHAETPNNNSSTATPVGSPSTPYSSPH